MPPLGAPLPPSSKKKRNGLFDSLGSASVLDEIWTTAGVASAAAALKSKGAVAVFDAAGEVLNFTCCIAGVDAVE